MTGLIIPAAALAPAPDCCGSIVPAPGADDATILDNGWYPAIDLAHFRKQMRVRDAITVERQREALLGALITVGNDLVTWTAARRAAGAADLAGVTDVPNDLFGGEPRLVVLFRRAAYAYAKAELVERMRDVDITAAGQRNIEELDGSVSELRRDAIYAIRDMLGRPRTCVELI